jgi:hypothetical protein
VQDSDAVSLLKLSMEAVQKVYKTAQIYFGTSDEQDKLVQKAINQKLASVNANMIVYKGVYGQKGKFVEYWFLMTGLLVIRGIDQRWGLMGPRITKKQWKKLATETKA